MTWLHVICLIIALLPITLLISFAISSVYNNRVTQFRFLRKRNICTICHDTIDETWLWKKFNNSYSPCNKHTPLMSCCMPFPIAEPSSRLLSSIEQSEILITAIKDTLHAKQSKDDIKKPQANKFIFLSEESC